MRIRHLAAIDNVDAEGFLRDPTQVRHGIVVAGRIADLAAPVDPLTHLNRDFPEHGLDDCLVAEALAIGAALLWDGDQMRFACAHPAAYAPLGRPPRAGPAALSGGGRRP
jgi:hypothetical protein